MKFLAQSQKINNSSSNKLHWTPNTYVSDKLHKPYTDLGDKTWTSYFYLVDNLRRSYTNLSENLWTFYTNLSDNKYKDFEEKAKNVDENNFYILFSMCMVILRSFFII